MTLARHATERELLSRLQAQAQGVRCVRCHRAPQIAWIDGTFKLRCDCLQQEPVLAPYDKDKERLYRMTQSQLQRADDTGNRSLATLTIREIKEMICPLATDIEAELFLRFCKAEEMNPFVNEAYLVKYAKDGKAAIVVGVSTYLKRAARTPGYKGFGSGIVVQDKNGAIHERPGSMEYPGDTLIGGWAVVHMAGRTDTKHTVSLKEYNQRRAQWNDKPATMIEKVAYAQALKRCIPGLDTFSSATGSMSVEVQTDETQPPEQQIQDGVIEATATVKEHPDNPYAYNMPQPPPKPVGTAPVWGDPADDVDALFGPDKDFPDIGTILTRVYKEYRLGKDAFLATMYRISRGAVKTESDLQPYGYRRAYEEFVADQKPKTSAA